MIITVTQDDVEKGNATLDACPITIALRRQFGNKVSVSRNFIRVLKKSSKKNKWALIPLPLAARNFLLSYYKQYTQEAFSFELSTKDVKGLK